MVVALSLSLSLFESFLRASCVAHMAVFFRSLTIDGPFFGKWAYLFPVFGPLCSVLSRFLRSLAENASRSCIRASACRYRTGLSLPVLCHARMHAYIDACSCRGTRHFLHVVWKRYFRAETHAVTRCISHNVMTIKCGENQIYRLLPRK